jgi:acetolactate synthase-1/2/3 large subunit
VLAASSTAIDAWLDGGQSGHIAPAVLLPDSTALNRPVELSDAQRIDRPGVTEFEVDRAQTLMKNSRRPVVVVGLEAARPGMAGPIKAFIDKLGAVALTTYMAKGCVADGDPSYVGIFTGGAIEQPCVREADLIVLLGLDPVELIRKPWPYEVPVLDICETAHTPHYLVPAQRLLGALPETLPVLGERLGATGRDTTWTKDEIAAHRARYFQGIFGRGAGSRKDLRRCSARPATVGSRRRRSYVLGLHVLACSRAA